MTSDKPYMDIEIFPCAGGMGEGFRRAGIVFDLMIEIEEEHCDSYEQNLGHRPTQMDARSFLEMLEMGWRPPRPVRLIVADPPCTPWSRAGKRKGMEDPRDMLWGTCEIIKHLQPQAYLIGNVPGLDDGPNLPIVQRTIGALSQHGYCTADFARLDAANYGVPQHRHRPFWFGHKKGPCIQWPAPTHGDPDELRDQETLPGIAALIPWVTCKQALGHLPLAELGRPIKLRKRGSNSKQHGSVEERPARTVGTSNLSDGNVILNPDQPRAGKKGKNHGAPQGQRVTPADHAWPAITASARGNQTIVDPLVLTEPTAKAQGPRARDRDRVPQCDRVNDPDKPSVTLTAKAARKGQGAHAVIPDFTIQDRRGGVEGLNTLDAPSHTILRNTHGNGSILLLNDKHPPAQEDTPAPTVGNKQRQAQVLQWSNNHPPSFANEPAMTQRATSGGGAVRAMQWPWDRPSTTVLADERLGPPGHHDEDYRILTTEGDGIVISEKAAAILQGFPETWAFCGETKKVRWSQIGQAMPPPLAHAVASSVVVQIEKTQAELEEAALRDNLKKLAKGHRR